MENNKITIGCVSPLMIVVFLAFFFAKIYNLINWSWWWVFSPIWIPILVSTILVILIIICKIFITWK